MTGVQAVIGRLKGQDATTVQTFIFAKDAWTADKAAAWLKEHGYRADKVDETAESFRFRQHDPEQFEVGSFRTIDVGKQASEPRWLLGLADVTLGEPGQLVRIPLAMLGRWVKGALRFAITKADLQDLVRNFRKRKTGEVVIDYEHASEYPERAQGQPIPAAGWLREIEDAPDERGILWGRASFTGRAREMIQAGEYKYISPAVSWIARDKETGEQQGCTLTSVALVNRPFLEGLPAIAMGEAGWTEEGTRMKATSVRLAEGDDKKLVVVCGECGKETSAEALPKPQVKVITLSDVRRTSEGRYDFAALSAAEAPIAPEVFRAQQAQAELDAAVHAGKITPAQRPHYEKLALSDLAGFRQLVQTLKPQVDLSEHGIAGGAEGGDLKKIDAQLDQLTREKVRASEGKLAYGQAFRLVLSEHPELKQKRAGLMRE